MFCCPARSHQGRSLWSNVLLREWERPNTARSDTRYLLEPHRTCPHAMSPNTSPLETPQPCATSTQPLKALFGTSTTPPGHPRLGLFGQSPVQMTDSASSCSACPNEVFLAFAVLHTAQLGLDGLGHLVAVAPSGHQALWGFDPPCLPRSRSRKRANPRRIQRLPNSHAHHPTTPVVIPAATSSAGYPLTPKR